MSPHRDPLVRRSVFRATQGRGVGRCDPALGHKPSRATLPVLGFDDVAADAYRQIVEAVGYSRRQLLDRMIAAQALVHRAMLVTMNAAGFRDVPGLELLSW